MPKRPPSLARQEPERSRAPASLRPFNVGHQVYTISITVRRFAKFTEKLRAFNVCTMRLVPAAAKIPRSFRAAMGQQAPRRAACRLTRHAQQRKAANDRSPAL